MKKIILALLISIPLFLHAQQGVVATGGDATGSGGTMSSSTGLTDFYEIQSEQFSLQFGLLHPYKDVEIYQLTLNLDMSLTPDFDPETNLVYVTGTFVGFWPEPGTDPENQLMSRVEETMIYTITLLLEPGEYEYKYFLNDGWDGGEWGAGENRQLTLTDEMEVNDFWGYLEYPDIIEVSTLSELRTMPPGDLIYLYTGEAVIVAMPGQSVATPFIYSDFEDNQNVNFAGFPNSPTIVENPDPSGINTSSHVAQWQRSIEPIAHAYAVLDGKIDFSEQHIFRVKIWSPIACEVLFKVEDKTDHTIAVEVSQYISTPGQWVELIYDFSGAESGMYDKIVIFMDFLSSTDNIFYFDDIKGPGYEGAGKSGYLAFETGNKDRGPNRNRKFMQDETAAIFIFDAPGNITTSYNLYDVITNVTGQIEVLNNMVRFLPTQNAPEALGNMLIEPYLFAMDEVTTNDQAKLIKFNNVTFQGIEVGEVFATGQNYTLTDGVSTFVLRTMFWDEDYIGMEIPHGALNITGVVTQFHEEMQITPRFAADIEEYFEPVMYNLTLNVDMSDVLNFDPDVDLVYVTGTFAGFWPIPGTDPDNQLMTRVDETMIWTKNFYLEEGEYQYKYFINDGWDGAEWSGEPNRQLTISGDTILNDLWNHFRVHVAAQPEEGGSVTGDGNYRFGMEATVNAWPAEGYIFLSWTKGGEIVSIQEIYNFLMPAEDISLIAHFELDDDPCLPPDWIPVTGMQYSMQVAAHLYLYGDISFNPNHILGAFVDGECRGIASPDPEQDGLVFLTISSNVISGETVELVIWDSENCEPCQTWQTLTFENLEQIGDPGNPYIATCQGFVEFSAAMGEGFTWFSMNVDPGSMFLSTMMGSLAPCNNDRVIGQTIYAIFHEGNWMGSLKEIDPTRSYKMHLCSNQELYLLGAPILSAPMNISNGFTWMGYTPQVCIPINTAMSNISPEPENNDRVIAQTTYAIYNNGQWMGSLKDLCPGKGYVFSLTHNTTLQYPENAGKGEMLAYAADLKDKTGPVAENMQYTMTVLGQLIYTDGNISLNANDIIYAVSGNEKRGSAWPDIQNDGLLFMNIASNNQANELINFIAWSDDLQQYVGISETINFESLRATGSLQSPFIFTMTDPLGTEIFGFTHNTIGEPYPNPTFGLVNFPYYLTEPSQVNLYIYNNMGQPVYISELNKEIPGSHTIVFEKEKLPRGIYLYKVVLYGKKDFIVKNGVLVVVE